MKLILKVSSDNEYCDGGCEFALVDLSREFAVCTLSRINLLRELKKADGALVEACYWDSHAQYFSLRADFSGLSEEEKSGVLEIADIIEGLADDEQELATALGDLEVPDTQVAAAECKQMVVRPDGITFVAIPKHCDFYVTSAKLPAPLLERAATTDES